MRTNFLLKHLQLIGLLTLPLSHSFPLGTELTEYNCQSVLFFFFFFFRFADFTPPPPSVVIVIDVLVVAVVVVVLLLVLVVVVMFIPNHGFVLTIQTLGGAADLGRPLNKR